MFVRTPLFDACVPNLDEFNKKRIYFIENDYVAMPILLTYKLTIVAISGLLHLPLVPAFDGNLSSGRYSR